MQSQYTAAISHLQRVLEISTEMGDHVGDADAYGTIADIYTDMGDFDAAAKCAFLYCCSVCPGLPLACPLPRIGLQAVETAVDVATCTRRPLSAACDGNGGVPTC